MTKPSFASRLAARLTSIVLSGVMAGGGALAPSAAIAAVEIAPHRAVYQMSLSSVRSGSSIADVRGRMLFEWSDACDGWTIEQRFQLEFLYAEGDQVQMTTNYVTWESKDGKRYRFNVRKLVDGRLDEELRGEAELFPDGKGIARYLRPEAVEIQLPAGTMFPTAHTLALLRSAASGDKFLARTIFDGSDAEGVVEISAVVGLSAEAKPAASGSEISDPLLRGTMWPIRLAFFPPTSTNAAPEYEMGMDLLENGVARSMSIDYGDFAVSAEVERLEAVARPNC